MSMEVMLDTYNLTLNILDGKIKVLECKLKNCSYSNRTMSTEGIECSAALLALSEVRRELTSSIKSILESVEEV